MLIRNNKNTKQITSQNTCKYQLIIQLLGYFLGSFSTQWISLRTGLNKPTAIKD